MANQDDRSSGGRLADMLISALGAMALWNASNKLSDEPLAPPTSDDPRALADRLSIEEPDDGFALILYRIDRWQRSNKLLGFPLGVVKRFTEDKAALLAALVAYFGFFSIFPLMLAFTSIIGFTLEPDQQKRFADEAASQIPVVGSKVIDTVNNNGEIGGSVWAIVAGIGLALWSGLKMIDAMQNALNEVWDVPPVDRPNLIAKRARSLLMLLLLGGGIVGSVAVSSLATYVDGLPGGGRFAIWAGSATISVLLYWVAFQLLTDRRLPWDDLVPGAVFGGVSWWALQTFGASIITNAADSDKTYGDFAAIIALMTFFFIAAQLSIFGAEISAVAARRLWPRSYIKGDLTEADIRSFESQAMATQRDPSYEVVLRPSRSARTDQN